MSYAQTFSPTLFKKRNNGDDITETHYLILYN